MRKLIALLLLVACVTSCKKDYEREIDRYLEEHLKDPDSYQNIKMGKPGIITPMSMAYIETIRRAKNGEFPIDSVNSKMNQIKEYFLNHGTNPYDTLGWEVSHKYRAKNSFGGMEICNVRYTFDKDMTKIIKMEDEQKEN